MITASSAPLTGLRHGGRLHPAPGPAGPVVARRESAVLQWLAWLVARLVYRVRALGRDHVPRTGPVLLISNHVSYVDWLVIMAVCRRKVRFVVASHFLKNPLIGWILRMGRVIPIDRK